MADQAAVSGAAINIESQSEWSAIIGIRAYRRLCAACRWQVLYGRAAQNCQFWGRLSFAVFLASASSTAAPAARAVGALR